MSSNVDTRPFSDPKKWRGLGILESRMVILRCTQKLLRRLRKTPAEEAPPSSTSLGDWYMNVIWVYRKPLILAVSARTLLPILIPARDPSTLGPRLAATLGQVLAALGIPGHKILEGRQRMTEIVFARTTNRSILGTMNDFDRMLEPAPGQSLTSAALELAEAPCGPIGMQSPDRATRDLFASPDLDSGSIRLPRKPEAR